MDGDSCINFDTVQVIVKKEFLHYIPAAFTPNGDGLNDRFEFDILGATTADVQIFDRWGEEVYSNPAQLNGIHQGGTNGWDGKFRGKDAQLDTYTYYIEVLLPGESTKRTLTGTIMPMH
jgi:gliding motility-associated-like protein